MNWEIVASVAEVIGAIGVIASLIYVARQVHSSQATAADSNRLNRSAGVCEMIRSYAVDDELRRSVVNGYGLEVSYEEMATTLGMPIDDAARIDFVNAYWFWLHWGQYSSTNDPKDLEELRHAISAYVEIPAINYSWKHSFLGKKYLDREFVEFVEKTMAEHRTGNQRNGT